MKGLTAAAAAFVLAAGAAVTAQDDGHGKANGADHPRESHSQPNDGKAEQPRRQTSGSMQAAMQGHGNAMRAASPRNNAMQAAAHGNSSAMQAAVPHGNGNAMRAASPHGTGNAMRGAESAMRAQGRSPAESRGAGKAEPPAKAKDRDRAAAARDKAHPAGAAAVAGGTGKQGPLVLPDGRHIYSAAGAAPSFAFAPPARDLIEGCPPGLAKKNNGCMPPGLAGKREWQPAWWGLPGLGNGRYVYDDGYLVRLNGGSVAGYVPLLGGALAVGNLWPSAYPSPPVPDYYVNYYDLGPPESYRYADDVLYRVDPATHAITSIAALLTGSDIRIGSPIPAGYDVYNVPYAYRDEYADGPAALYRYSDGYIYQIDPATRLVTAAIDLIAH
jgi:hypothetical protein